MTLVEWLQHPYIVTFVRWLLASIFLFSCIRKLLDRRRFRETVLAYQILPNSFAPIFAALLPWLEALVGCMLLLGLATAAGAVASSLLLLSFTAAIGINLARGRTDLDCGCFGADRSSKISGWLVARNLVLALLSLQVAFFTEGSFTLDRFLFGGQNAVRQDVSLEGLLVTVFIGVGLIVTWLLFKQMKALRQYNRS